MEQLSAFSSLSDVLHALSQGLLIPDIILLLGFACYALFCIGSIVMEYFTERRNFRVAMPKFLNNLMKAEEDEIPEVIRTSALLNRQKSALLTVYDYRTLHDDALLALIRRTVYAEEKRYDSITGRNNTAAKISPMLGLMGTLIPLGPGVAALGQADTTALSTSLLVAFDTTVAGLAVAAVCLAVGKIRGNWYGDYLSTLESAMATMLQKIEDMREAGTLTASEPSDYAFLFEKGLSESPKRASETASSRTATPEHAQDSGAQSSAPQAVSAPATAAHAAASSPTPAANPAQAGTNGAGTLTQATPSASAPSTSGVPAWQRSSLEPTAAHGQAASSRQAAQAPAIATSQAPAAAAPTTASIAGYTTISGTAPISTEHAASPASTEENGVTNG